MKKLLLYILAITLFAACDNPKSSRHLFRAANRVSQTEKEEPAKSKNDYLISFTETIDTNGNKFFRALYTLPTDTSLFFWNISLNMPENLKFNGRLDSCTVYTLFYTSIADTINQPLFEHIYNFKSKQDGFYNISKKTITH